jgi:hypothetical protein
MKETPMKSTAVAICLAVALPALPACAGAAVADNLFCATPSFRSAGCGPALWVGEPVDLLAGPPAKQEALPGANGELKGEQSSFSLLTSIARITIGSVAWTRGIGDPLVPPLSAQDALNPLYSDATDPLTYHGSSGPGMRVQTSKEQQDRDQGAYVMDESEGYALLLAGLGLLGIVAQRRLQNLI